MLKIELDKGFAIKFPYRLKDNFRKAFPSAKWNRINKQWEVGPRSGKRLDQWIEAASPTAQAIVEQDKTEFSVDELAELERELREINEEVVEKTQQHESLTELLVLAGKRKDEIAKAAQIESDLSSKIADQKKEAMALLESIIDMKALQTAHSTMKKLHSLQLSWATTEFREAQAVVGVQYKKLAAAGWHSKGIYDLWNANVNRPDRDHADKIYTDDYIKLSEAVEDTED